MSINESKELEMNSENENGLTMADIFEDSFVSIHGGKILEGEVIDIHDNAFIINLGYKNDGMLPFNKTFLDKDIDPTSEIHIGDIIEVEVVNNSDKNEYVALSRVKILQRFIWDEIAEIFENNETIETEVIDVIKGGLIADYSGIRIFIPASQIAIERVSDLEKYKGQTIRLRVIEFDRKKRNVVASQKVILQEERVAKVAETLASLEEGQVLEGVVRNITNYGAFVDLGGIDGLLHVSDISWHHVRNPKDALKVGESIQVKVMSFDKESNKIALSKKHTTENPWVVAETKYAVGNTITGKVVRIADFGAFVNLEENIDGLVHISEISHDHVKNIADVLTIGDDIEVQVIALNTEDKKIGLSIKALTKKPAPVVEEKIVEPEPVVEKTAEELELEESIKKYSSTNENVTVMDSLSQEQLDKLNKFM